VKKLDEVSKELDAKIKDYLDRLDEADRQEADVKTPTAEQLKEKIERLRARKLNYEQMQKQLKESGETQVSLTDSDSRSMKVSQGLMSATTCKR
jgi:DNA repair exonuclease SbcCD ATPase subunit